MRAQLISATALAAAVLTGTPQAAQAQPAPSGSYAATCANIRSAGDWLSAECRTSSTGAARWSAIRYRDCRSDISNRDGLLTCTGATATTDPLATQGVFGQILGGLIGGLIGQGSGQQAQPLYADGYRYPDYGQYGYGDARFDPRFGPQGWGYGRDGQWVPTAERQAWFENRMQTGLRQNVISNRDVTDLRRGFNDITRLEIQASRGGLSNAERIDLDRRFDQLAARIRITVYDDGGWSGSAWRSVAERRADLERAVSDAQGRGRISRTEAARIRADYESLVDLEEGYQRDTIDRFERNDLDQRYDALLARTGSAGGSGGGWGGGSAAVWTGPTISDQAASIDAQIESQRRAGRLSRTEAARLGDDLDALVRLESDYRRDSLSRTEADDLNRRLQDLNNRINVGVVLPAVQGPVADRRPGILARIDTAQRNRRISSQEGQRLRTELDQLLSMETDYGRDGLSAAERNYLDGRLNALEAFIPR